MIFLLGLLFFAHSSVTVVKTATPVPGIHKVWVYGNTKNPSSVAIVLSGDGGWILGVVDVAKHLAKQNVMVIGINDMPYLKYQKKNKTDCFNMAADIDSLSHYIQNKYHINNYQKPVIIGFSLGATYAYGILSQAPPHTFKGAISIGFCNDINSPVPLCPEMGLTCTKRLKGKGYDLQAVNYLSDPFVIIQGEKDHECPICQSIAFMEQVPGSSLVQLQHVNHGGLSLHRWLPSILSTYQQVIGLSK
jgi:hypothetical protein